MFKNRSFNSFVGVTIAVLAVLSIGAMAINRLNTSVVNLSPLDWYFSHDHAPVDSDNVVVSSDGIPVTSSPVDWYFSHDHAILDGDDNAMVIRPTNVSAEQAMRMVIQELECERLDQLNATLYVERMRAHTAAQDLEMVMQEQERERFPQTYAKSFGAASQACLDSRVSCDR